MKFLEISKEILNEPKQWLALIISILFLSLTLKEVAALWVNDNPEIYLPQKSEKLRVVISERSPLFSSTIFGVYVSKTDDMEVRQSTLNVEIEGILYSNDEQNSQVLIKTSSGDEKLFTVGATLPGGAIIKKISKDKIIVLYRGVLESVTMKQSELIFYKPQSHF